MKLKLITIAATNADNVDDNGVVGVYLDPKEAAQAGYDKCVAMLRGGTTLGQEDLDALLRTFGMEGWEAFYDLWKDVRDNHDFDMAVEWADWEIAAPLGQLFVPDEMWHAAGGDKGDD